MRNGQYATYQVMAAPLYSDFARPFLERRFSPVVVAALYEAVGTYKSGPRKGKTRGYVHWIKCINGGWYRPNGAGGHGFVLRPGSHEVVVRINRDPLSRCVLDETANATDENRIAAIQELVNS